MKTGTREWSEHSVNCVTGCSHNCRYCYARYNAVKRFGTVKSDELWQEEVIRENDKHKKRKKLNGIVMFPTTHDITPKTLDACVCVLDNLLFAGNEVLIVSKPHFECVRFLCDLFTGYKDKIMFRFSIGAIDSGLLSYWEPGAPCYSERLDCLKHAFVNGYKTSVSCEPLLEYNAIAAMINDFLPYVTDKIWIGKMNKIETRVSVEDDIFVNAVKDGQTDEKVIELFNRYKKNKKIEWKDSYKEIIKKESEK